MVEKKLDLPKKIKSIERKGDVEYISGYKQIVYILNKGTKDEKVVTSFLENKKDQPLEKQVIAYVREEICNGFRLVELKSGEYAYQTEKGILLPYRYTIASDFNEYGLAMVGRKDGNVTWINKNFEYINAEGKIVNDTENANPLPSFANTKKVCEFSKGENPLGRITFKSADHNYEGTSYIDTTGKIKGFAQYSGKNSSYNHEFTLFKEDLGFNEEGYVYQKREKAVLLATGYYITTASMVNIVMENGMMNDIVRITKEEPKTKIKKQNEV